MESLLWLFWDESVMEGEGGGRISEGNCLKSTVWILASPVRCAPRELWLHQCSPGFAVAAAAKVALTCTNNPIMLYFSLWVYNMLFHSLYISQVSHMSHNNAADIGILLCCINKFVYTTHAQQATETLQNNKQTKLDGGYIYTILWSMGSYGQIKTYNLRGVSDLAFTWKTVTLQPQTTQPPTLSDHSPNITPQSCWPPTHESYCIILQYHHIPICQVSHWEPLDVVSEIQYNIVFHPF